MRPRLSARYGSVRGPRRDARQGARRAVSGHRPCAIRVCIRPQWIVGSFEKMLRLMVESQPRMFVLPEKGDVRRRKVRVDKSADRYTYDPGHDIPFPRQWCSALRAKAVGQCPLTGSWTHERFVRSVDLDLLSLVICSYTEHGACATMTFVAVARNH